MSIVGIKPFVSEFLREVPHRRDREMKPLEVAALPGPLRTILDHQHLAISMRTRRQRTRSTAQLVSKDPDGLEAFALHQINLATSICLSGLYDDRIRRPYLRVVPEAFHSAVANNPPLWLFTELHVSRVLTVRARLTS